KSSAQVKEVIKAAKFHPLGERGVCRFVRAAGYSSVPRGEYFKNANKRLIVAQLEGAEAIDNLDELIENAQMDVLFIGPYDLSQSLGVPGDVSNPLVIEKIKQIIKKAKEKNITVGTFADTKESLDMWKSAGVKYLAYSVDVGLFYDKCKEITEGFV
ncbi:MAG: aldolase/citrate lyase family protein, partial [Oscillospiraceae bacterium]|nr:aldolase/citrate lyase family protein [Oscillospiraceae bacterium]